MSCLLDVGTRAIKRHMRARGHKHLDILRLPVLQVGAPAHHLLLRLSAPGTRKRTLQAQHMQLPVQNATLGGGAGQTGGMKNDSNCWKISA
jgi:hypothetical protein